MSLIWKPITEEIAYQIATNLREEDYREVYEGHGVDPLQGIPECSMECEDCEYMELPDGRVGGVAGVYKDGMIWMLTTPAILDYPITFARGCMKWLAARKHHEFLWNIVDKRNTVHLRLLEFLGFSFLREVKNGPNNLTFIEFYKWNQSHLD
tara:strand:- start:1223 stop:1678 length:456 start_codon:yes stop_codon:yes gene_type:complete